VVWTAVVTISDATTIRAVEDEAEGEVGVSGMIEEGRVDRTEGRAELAVGSGTTVATVVEVQVGVTVEVEATTVMGVGVLIMDLPPVTVTTDRAVAVGGVAAIKTITTTVEGEAATRTTTTIITTTTTGDNALLHLPTPRPSSLRSSVSWPTILPTPLLPSSPKMLKAWRKSWCTAKTSIISAAQLVGRRLSWGWL